MKNYFALVDDGKMFLRWCSELFLPEENTENFKTKRKLKRNNYSPVYRIVSYFQVSTRTLVNLNLNMKTFLFVRVQFELINFAFGFVV